MTLAVDFDGVIHTYSLGWHDGTIYDPPMPGAIEGLRTLMDFHAVFIHTTREPEQVMPWLEQHGFDVTIDERCGKCRGDGGGQELDADSRPAGPAWECDACKGFGLFTFWNLRGQLLVTNRKLPAAAYLDDRAVRFHNWEQALTAMGVNPRLLDCGYCYEEWGEEVHPNPECPKGQRRARVDGRTHLDREQLVEQARLDPAVPCCVCGGPVVYDNYKGDLFCWRCADCDCGRDVCLRTGLHRPAAGMCTATWKHPHRGLIPCDQEAEHYTSDYCVHQGRTPDGSPMQWRDGDTGATPHRPNTIRTAETAEATTSPDTVRTTLDKGPATGGIVRTSAVIGETGCDLTIPYSAPLSEDTGGPAAPGVPRCTATWDTRFDGIVTCWRAAAHNTRDEDDIHVGEVERGCRYQWRDIGRYTTPHQPRQDTGRTPCTATFLEPFHGLAHCEQHADRDPFGRPGPWHEGTSEDGSRLFWGDNDPGATPHRSDTVRTVQDTRPDTDDTARTLATPDTDTPAPTSTDTARTPHPDTITDTPDGVRMLYTARVPRAQMGAAWAEGLGHLHQLLAEHQADEADQPAPATADDKPRPATTYDLTLGPDSLTDAERERKTILDTLNTQLSNDEPEAVWALTLDIQRALEAMPRYAGTARLSAAEQEAAPANDERLGTPENAHFRLGLARKVLVDDGYFTDDEVGPDLAPRLVEWLSHHRGLADTARKEVDVLRARVGELAATLAETIGHFTIPANLNGAVLRTGHVPAATVERWRRVHTGNGPTGWMFPPVQGHCPACNRGSLFLGSGGYVSCSHLDCSNPEAPTDLLDNHEALAEAEERARRQALAYEDLRCDVITAVAYIRQQKERVGPFSSLRHSRSRILTVLPTWIKDPGPLDPPSTPTEER